MAMGLKSYLFMALVTASLAAHGQAYKCRTPSGGSVFSESPCSNGNKTERSAVDMAPTRTGEYYGEPSAASMRNQNELTAKVASALASNDLSRARGIALTQEHWKMISDAEQRINTPVTGRTKADVRAEASQSRECRDAKMSYENEASSIKNNHALIDSAKRNMYAACGIDAPNEVTVRNTTIVNNPPSNVSRPMNCYTYGNGRMSCN